jgi:PTS system cellobiose-specific IIC component
VPDSSARALAPAESRASVRARFSVSTSAESTAIAAPSPSLPPVISGFIVTGHLSGSVMQLINLLIGAMLYLPFMRIVDKQYRAAEMATVTQTDTTLAKQE